MVWFLTCLVVYAFCFLEYGRSGDEIETHLKIHSNHKDYFEMSLDEWIWKKLIGDKPNTYLKLNLFYLFFHARILYQKVPDKKGFAKFFFIIY